MSRNGGIIRIRGGTMDFKLLNFDMPKYIEEELEDYISDTNNGHNKCMKLENIKSLIGLAVLNERITREQGDCIISKLIA